MLQTGHSGPSGRGSGGPRARRAQTCGPGSLPPERPSSAGGARKCEPRPPCWRTTLYHTHNGSVPSILLHSGGLAGVGRECESVWGSTRRLVGEGYDH